MKHCSLEFLPQELNAFTVAFKAADTPTLLEVRGVSLIEPRFGLLQEMRRDRG